MRQMFESATLKLTAWYLLIIMTISLILSFIIFEVSTNEISSRLERLQVRMQIDGTVISPDVFSLTDLRQRQASEAEVSIFFGLVYINLAILVLAGAGGYVLARRTLRPIEEAHEAQSRFTSDASHELKTPLAVMRSEIEVTLRDEAATKADFRELLKSNLEEVEKLTALSQALLQLSRLDYSDLEKNERTDMFEVLITAASTLDKASKRISLTPPSRPILIDGNTAMLGELCMILLDNALKYSTKGSVVTTSIISNGRNCVLSVANDGKGIETQDLPHIFDRFYQADRSRTSHGTVKGYGLGLSLAKKIVDFHDGQITVKSLPGKVTTFSVHLPNVQKNR